MPKKTLYVSDADLPFWNSVEEKLGETSMSKLVMEALKEKVGKPIDGFLNVIRSSPGLPLAGSPFAVMFTPVDSPAGAMKPHHCASLDDLKAFLSKLGLTARAIDGVVADVDREYHSNMRVSLMPHKIDLI